MQEGEKQFNTPESIPEPENGVGNDNGTESAFEKSASVVSNRELKDLKMKVSTKGWFKYWVERLKSQTDLLPKGVADVVRKAALKNPISSEDSSIFVNYINRRIDILKFDLMKRSRMESLRKKLWIADISVDEKTWNTETTDEGRREITFDEARNSFFVEHNGKQKNISLGDIAADYGWGIKYRLSSSMPPRFRRLLSKRIAVNEARRDIEDIYNKELVGRFGEKFGIYKTADMIFGGMAGVEKRINETKMQDTLKGVVGENMAREFLTRVSIDNPELGFAVQRANAYEDTFLKYDFRLQKRFRARGIIVEDENLKSDIKKLGVQFTVGGGLGKESKMAEGRERIKITSSFVKRPVQELALVKVQFDKLNEYFKQWVRNGKPSGGPEQYMTNEEKRQLLVKATENFISLSESDIDAILKPEERIHGEGAGVRKGKKE